MEDQGEDEQSCRFFPDLDIDPAISGIPIPENPTITHKMIEVQPDE